MRAKFFALLLGGALLASAAQAEEDESGLHGDAWYERSWNAVATAYRKGDSELYVPLKTYHLRSAYSAEKIAGFNETPYGLGYGRGYSDDSGNFHGVYAMGFQDSHAKPEWMLGYTWKAMWGDRSGWQSGLGYTAFLTTRSDIGNYTPIPGVLPVAAVAYRNFSLEGTFVPGGKGNGNVFFFWGKWSFDR